MSVAELPVLRCWHCSGTAEKNGHKCWACGGTGSLFWSAGRGFPYTPEGEQRAVAAQRRETTG